MKTLKNTLLVLSTGYLFVYFSEHLFWARIRPDDSLQNWISAWIAYSLMAYVFLSLVSAYRIKTIWPLFLAGAVFGWLSEGVVVFTTYESLPFSISFTGLAWHALITVGVGWYALQQAFQSQDDWASLKLAVAIGLGYGFWAITWWLEPDGGIASTAEFAGFSLTITLLLILACWLANWSLSEPFMPDRWVNWAVGAVFGLYFIFVTVPAAPTALFILPPLLGLVYLGLRQNRKNQSEGSLLDPFRVPVAAWKYLSLLGVPAAAVLVYAAAMFFNLRLHTNWILYLITTPAGFIFFGLSLYQVLRKATP